MYTFVSHVYICVTFLSHRNEPFIWVTRMRGSHMSPNTLLAHSFDILFGHMSNSTFLIYCFTSVQTVYQKSEPVMWLLYESKEWASHVSQTYESHVWLTCHSMYRSNMWVTKVRCLSCEYGPVIWVTHMRASHMSQTYESQKSDVWVKSMSQSYESHVWEPVIWVKTYESNVWVTYLSHEYEPVIWDTRMQANHISQNSIWVKTVSQSYDSHVWEPFIWGVKTYEPHVWMTFLSHEYEPVKHMSHTCRVAKTHRMPWVAGYFSQKETLIIGLFCGRWPIKIRHPMVLRHPVWVPCLSHGYEPSAWERGYMCTYMHVYICICMYTYKYTCKCVRIYTHTHTHTHTHTNANMHIYIYIYIHHTHIYAYLYMYVHICVRCVCARVCACMCACAYIHTYSLNKVLLPGSRK